MFHGMAALSVRVFVLALFCIFLLFLVHFLLMSHTNLTPLLIYVSILSNTIASFSSFKHTTFSYSLVTEFTSQGVTFLRDLDIR
jgi:hypothetical protein